MVYEINDHEFLKKEEKKDQNNYNNDCNHYHAALQLDKQQHIHSRK